MKCLLLATLAATALLFLISSCATRPVFDLKTGSNLIPGSTATAQARQILGPPDYTSQVKDSQGDTLLWNYNYARVLNNGTVTMNRLSLTFQKEVLQQYCYQWSSGPQLPRSTQIAKALGRDDDYRFFLHRSLNDRNLFNPALRLMNGKTADGKWAPIGGSQDTNENRSVAGWTEGDAWVYTWSPFHDQAGLIELLGGREAYGAKLDAHFSGGHNVHSNEPSHHYAYLYDFAGQPWKTQAKVREIAAAEYGYDAGGLDGDDDCGQMSAWLLFSAMGFYPVNPASGEYMIGSPLFSGMSIRLQNGKTFRVHAEGNSARNLYVQSATLDGKPLKDPLITWEQIQSGATLTFKMGPKPSRWGSDWRPVAIPAK